MRLVLVLCFALLTSLSASAAEKKTAFGLTVGSPSGFTGRTWVNQENSFNYGAGWGIVSTRKFEVYADYLWNRPNTFEINGEQFDFFFGGGLSLRSNSGKRDNDLVFGPRFPVGVSYEFEKPELELFALFALNVGVVPSSEVYADLLIGARFYIF